MLIEEWGTGGDVERDLAMLAEVLHATVHAGASVSFVLPFSKEESLAFWREKVLTGVRGGNRRVLVAREGGEIIGTVQLGLDTVPNQRHRAEVTKLLVHPKARRRGIARALMTALEAVALEEGRTLLTLDTQEAGVAERLYLSMGYVLVGVIPRYARKALVEEMEGASFLYKELA
jgi:ribosomal protein S18 acetylase RimI-like enzyme